MKEDSLQIAECRLQSAKWRSGHTTENAKGHWMVRARSEEDRRAEGVLFQSKWDKTGIGFRESFACFAVRFCPS